MRQRRGWGWVRRSVVMSLGATVAALGTGAGCGGSEEQAAPAGAAGSTTGASGSSGASAGKAGSAGQPAAGSGGAAGGKAGAGGSPGGAAGAAGKAGSAGASGASGNGGTAGAGGGSGGAAGASGGAGGKAGSGGAPGCANDAECIALLGATVPSDCADAKCDPMQKLCSFTTKDKDKDGFGASQCLAKNGVAVQVGADCDDTDPNVSPKAWDGPAGDGKPNHCGDGIDQDCNGKIDDGKLMDGTACGCTPQDVQACSEDASGKPIDFPKLDGAGKPLGKCKRGAKTCGSDAKWGPCVGAVGPDPFEICNGGIDDDCDGLADMADSPPPNDTITWTYDGDGDNFADRNNPNDVRGQACPDKPPVTCPTSVPGCDPKKWKAVALTATDCDDKDANVSPVGAETCNGKDDDCNDIVDDAPSAPLWFFDYDGDNFGDINTSPVRSCSAPTTLPDGCDVLAQNLPAGYCAGLVQEGVPPVCPPPACTASMWKKNIPNTDCRDRPDLSPTGKGNNPKLVYPGASDLCNSRDYSCDGTPDTGCGCSPIATTEACGSPTTCNVGTRECLAGGTWGACSGGPDQGLVDYCQDDDEDTFCNFSNCVAGRCPGDKPVDAHKYRDRSTCTGASQPASNNDCDDALLSVNPSAVEVCDGKDNNCKAGIDENFSVGTSCNNGLVGSCAKSGAFACKADGSSACDAGTYADVPTQTWTATPIHGGFDVNCDGKISINQPQVPFVFGPVNVTDPARRPPTGMNCGTSAANLKALCSAMFPDCATKGHALVVACGAIDNVGATTDVSALMTVTECAFIGICGTYVPRCGDPTLRLFCGNVGNGCEGGAAADVQLCR